MLSAFPVKLVYIPVLAKQRVDIARRTHLYLNSKTTNTFPIPSLVLSAIQVDSESWGIIPG